MQYLDRCHTTAARSACTPARAPTGCWCRRPRQGDGLKLDGFAAVGLIVGREARADVGRAEVHATAQALRPAEPVATAVLLGKHWRKEASPDGAFLLHDLELLIDDIGFQ